MLAISAISFWPSSVAALSLEASGARPTISRVCASRPTSWRSSLATCSRRSRVCVSRLWRRARASAAAVVSSVRRVSAPARAVSAWSWAASAFCSKSPARRAVLASEAISAVRRSSVSLASAISVSSRAMSRTSCSTRDSRSRCRSAVRCASRSRLSCSILKRASTAPLAASWSRSGCSCAAASASARSPLDLASVACPTFSSASARLASSPSTWAWASAHLRCRTTASSLRISAEISL